VRGASSTTFADRQSGTWCAPASRSALPCGSAATGRAAFFDRYDITSEADLELAAERTSTYVAEKRTEGARIMPLAGRSTPDSDNPSDSAASELTVASATR
jgi:hypothetical protein